MKYLRAFLVTVISCVSFACTEQADHPKLIKTIGHEGYGNVYCSLVDKAGNLWFGTTENGLYKYDGKKFTQFLVADGLSSNGINALLQDTNGNIWIGTDAGLCMYNGATFTKVQIPLPDSLLSTKNPKYRNSHGVHHIIQAKDGTIWVVTMDGVFTYDGKSFTQFVIDKTANGFLTDNDKAERVLEDRDGNIWFGGRTNPGVYQYDGKSIIKFSLDTLFQQGPKPKPHNWAWPQVQDRNGNIWFNNWGGVYRYDGKSFTVVDTPGEIMRITEDKQGNIWLGGDRGLSRYDGKTFTNYGTKDGLATPRVWSILEDADGNLWIGTRHTGLYLFDGNTFIKYSKHQNELAVKQQ